MPDPDPRSYPRHPLLGVSVALWRDGTVLLAQRGKPPLAGLWSLPGGLVEAGERLATAASRELEEETGVAGELAGIADWHEVIIRDPAGAVERHFVLAVFAGRWRAGEAHAQGDAEAVRWARPEELAGLEMTQGTADIILRTERFLDR